MGSVIPLYYQIKQTLKSWVIQKEYPVGGKIPSIDELAKKFRVNRLTVRQAISQLIQEGFLTSRRGEGTFVTSDDTLINRFSFEFSGFIDDLLHQVMEVKTKMASMKRIAASNFIRQMLALKPDEKEVVQIKRVRLVENSLFTYTINYLPVEIGLLIEEKDLYKKRLLQILEHDLSIKFTEAVQTIEATFADSEVAEILGINSGSPTLFVQRTMFVHKRKPIDLYQSYFRGDLYKFIVRFKNVRSKDGSKWIQRG